MRQTSSQPNALAAGDGITDDSLGRGQRDAMDSNANKAREGWL